MITRGTGDVFPAEASLSYVGDGFDRLTTVMLRDVSVRERLEAESRARVEAETTSRRIMLMLSYVAHEMGNPLNGLLGFAQLMASDTDHPLVPEQSRRLEHMLASGRILETLLRDVLDLGRFKTGHLLVDLIPVDAARSVADAVAAVSVQAGQSKVSLAVSPASPALRVIADAGRLHQCLLNLLTNAIKYNRSGGWVKIAVQRDEEGVTISVRDNGLGIDAAQREHLFEPFNRLGRQPAAAPGSGLGLVITRLLVGAMNGYLRVESEAGIGSCFSITLPGPSIDPIPGGAVSQAGATPRQPAEPR
jgi:signal transduction histidine kinase